MTELVPIAKPVVDEDDIRAYAGMYVLKLMDLKPEDGGMTFPLVLPSELTPLDEILHDLAVAGMIEQHKRKDEWQLTKVGLAYLARLIEEAEDLVDEFDDAEVPEMLAALRERNLDPMRARFLWGWFEGELDDLTEFQRQRGVRPVQSLWAYYLTDDELYAELAKDFALT